MQSSGCVAVPIRIALGRPTAQPCDQLLFVCNLKACSAEDDSCFQTIVLDSTDTETMLWLHSTVLNTGQTVVVAIDWTARVLVAVYGEGITACPGMLWDSVPAGANCVGIDAKGAYYPKSKSELIQTCSRACHHKPFTAYAHKDWLLPARHARLSVATPVPYGGTHFRRRAMCAPSNAEPSIVGATGPHQLLHAAPRDQGELRRRRGWLGGDVRSARVDSGVAPQAVASRRPTVCSRLPALRAMSTCAWACGRHS